VSATEIRDMRSTSLLITLSIISPNVAAFSRKREKKTGTTAADMVWGFASWHDRGRERIVRMTTTEHYFMLDSEKTLDL